MAKRAAPPRAAQKGPTSPPRKRRPGRPPKHPHPDVDARFPGARVIKRYGNRRLYDAQLSRVVTMEEIAELVRAGEDVRVVDGDTGEDLTRRVLTQLILEEQNRRQLELLPVELLQRILSARSDQAVGWIEQAMGTTMKFLQSQWKAIEAGREVLQRAGVPFPQAPQPATSSPGEGPGRPAWTPWSPWAPFPSDRKYPAPDEAGPAPGPTVPEPPAAGGRKKPRKGDDDEGALREELDELQRRMAELAARMPRQPRR